MSTSNLASAIEDFRRARQRAILKEMIARLTGEQVNLLSYDEVRRRLKAAQSMEKGIQEIPLDSIIGSVNRYTDFTRDFLPRSAVHADRWANVEIAYTGMTGVPPIEVYQLGDVYFVKDGNHRVSVARQLGANTIEAYVTEIKTKVPVTTETTTEDLILKAEYAEFLEKTRLIELRPEADLALTVPGKYGDLEEHISVHRYFMGIEQLRDISYEEAVAHWYDTVYRPMTQIMNNYGILDEFPGRTEADLYLWIAEHRADLAESLESDIRPEDAALHLAETQSPRLRRVVSRLQNRIKRAILPSSLTSGPRAGSWRHEKAHQQAKVSLFDNILVPIVGDEKGWVALEQAITIANKENAQIHGMHVVPAIEDRENDTVRELHRVFIEKLESRGVTGSFIIETGDIIQNVCERARWNDLIVMKLNYPPVSPSLTSITHGFRAAIQRCPRPVLAVPDRAAPLTKVLLAYDGSPKANEALFIATYITGKWNIPLLIVSVEEAGLDAEKMVESANAYVEGHAQRARKVVKQGRVGEIIMNTIDNEGCDLLLIGGYGRSSLVSVVLGSTVDNILMDIKIPALICR